MPNGIKVQNAGLFSEAAYTAYDKAVDLSKLPGGKASRENRGQTTVSKTQFRLD